MKTAGTQEVFNYRKVSEQIATSGQPTAEQFEAIAKAGFEVVIDLAPVDMSRYSIAGEPQLVSRLGMTYCHIPVDFKQPDIADLERFFEAMDQASGRKLWIHCAANYRVTVFYSLWAESVGIWDAAESDRFIRSVWESDPDWVMSDAWKAFIDIARKQSLPLV